MEEHLREALASDGYLGAGDNGRSLVEVWGVDGTLRHRSRRLGEEELGGPPQGADEPSPVSRVLRDGTPVRVRSGVHRIGDEPVVLRVALSEEGLRREWSRLRLGVLLGLPAAVAIAGLGGHWLAGRALAPLDRLARQAESLTVDNLGERLTVENPEDELGHLARVFNLSLARIEDSVAQLRRFTADASHELRTPLTAIRAVGEVALQAQRDPERYRETIGSMLEEADRLSRLVDGLLFLSRADAGQSLHRQDLALVELVKSSVSLLEILAEERNQRLEVRGDTGHPDRRRPPLPPASPDQPDRQRHQVLATGLGHRHRRAKGRRLRSAGRDRRRGPGNSPDPPGSGLRALLPDRPRTIARRGRRRTRPVDRPLGDRAPRRDHRGPKRGREREHVPHRPSSGRCRRPPSGGVDADSGALVPSCAWPCRARPRPASHPRECGDASFAPVPRRLHPAHPRQPFVADRSPHPDGDRVPGRQAVQGGPPSPGSAGRRLHLQQPVVRERLPPQLRGAQRRPRVCRPGHGHPGARHLRAAARRSGAGASGAEDGRREPGHRRARPEAPGRGCVLSRPPDTAPRESRPARPWPSPRPSRRAPRGSSTRATPHGPTS